MSLNFCFYFFYARFKFGNRVKHFIYAYLLLTRYISLSLHCDGCDFESLSILTYPVEK